MTGMEKYEITPSLISFREYYFSLSTLLTPEYYKFYSFSLRINMR